MGVGITLLELQECKDKNRFCESDGDGYSINTQDGTLIYGSIDLDEKEAALTGNEAQDVEG